MNLLMTAVRAKVIELARMPAYVIPTLLLPTMFFVLFAAPAVGERFSPEFAMTSFAAFAVFGVAFFQFGIGVASERASRWERFLRVLPASPFVRLCAYAGSALVFAGAAMLPVVLVSTIALGARLDPLVWPVWVGAIYAGSIPLVFMGLAMGYWAQPRSAAPIANVLYLLLSFAGGLWAPPRSLPIGPVSGLLPTHQYGELVWSVVTPGGFPWASVAWLAAYSALFMLIALWGYRRDEGIKYR